jgi:hypothetical protein
MPGLRVHLIELEIDYMNDIIAARATVIQWIIARLVARPNFSNTAKADHEHAHDHVNVHVDVHVVVEVVGFCLRGR